MHKCYIKSLKRWHQIQNWIGKNILSKRTSRKYRLISILIEQNNNHAQRVHKIKFRSSFKVATSNSQGLCSVDQHSNVIFTKFYRRCFSVGCCNFTDVVMASSYNVVITTSFRRWYYDVASTLRQLCEEHKMWAIHGQMVTFLQTCLKVVKKFNKDMAFLWYAATIFWHQTQFVISLSYSKSSPKKCFQNFQRCQEWGVVVLPPKTLQKEVSPL